MVFVLIVASLHSFIFLPPSSSVSRPPMSPKFNLSQTAQNPPRSKLCPTRARGDAESHSCTGFSSFCCDPGLAQLSSDRSTHTGLRTSLPDLQRSRSQSRRKQRPASAVAEQDREASCVDPAPSRASKKTRFSGAEARRAFQERAPPDPFWNARADGRAGRQSVFASTRSLVSKTALKCVRPRFLRPSCPLGARQRIHPKCPWRKRSR